jgi:polyisoprenoid-binding protein YceI
MKRVFSWIGVAVFVLGTAGAGAQTPPPPAPPPAGDDVWNIDTNHTSAQFAVKHMMVSTVRGTLGPVKGTVRWDGKNPKSALVDVTVDVNGLSTANQKRDDHLRSPDFFDAANHPTITFKSKRVEPAGDGRFKLIGDLTIRGTTKEVTLDVEGPSPITKTQRGIATGATATTKINRLEYGLKWNRMIEAGPVVSDEVSITIDLELGRPAAPGTAASQQ